MGVAWVVWVVGEREWVWVSGGRVCGGWAGVTRSASSKLGSGRMGRPAWGGGGGGAGSAKWLRVGVWRALPLEAWAFDVVSGNWDCNMQEHPGIGFRSRLRAGGAVGLGAGGSGVRVGGGAIAKARLSCQNRKGKRV